MLPPIDSAILAQNPKFEALYNDLCNQRLNADGSSKLTDPKTIRDRDAFLEDLHRVRKDAEFKRLVQDGLQKLIARANELPDELLELSALILATSKGEIPPEDAELVGDEIRKLETQDKFLPIAKILSKQIQEDAVQLARLLDPDANAATITALPLAIQKLQTEIDTTRGDLATKRLQIIDGLTSLHAVHRQVLESCIQLLERTIHGAVSRATRAKADYIATVAECMAKKLSVQNAQLMQQTYTPEIQSLLKVRIGETEQQKISLRRKIREAEEELEKYRAASGAAVMAKDYVEVLRKTERVRAEIARLK